MRNNAQKMQILPTIKNNIQRLTVIMPDKVYQGIRLPVGRLSGKQV
jgi:hypothetical protein